MSKEAFICMLSNKTERCMSNTPKRHFVDMASTRFEPGPAKAEYHVKRFDFPKTDNPYFVNPMKNPTRLQSQ